MSELEKILEEIDDLLNTYSKNPYLDDMDVTDVCYGISQAKDIVRKHLENDNGGWTSIEERMPESESYILLSFANFSIPLVGRYEQDEDGGAFYIGDDDIACMSQGVFVNAWMPLSEPYRPERSEE